MNKKEIDKMTILELLREILIELRKLNKNNADNKQTTKKAKEPKGGENSEQGDKASSLQSDGVEETQDSVSSTPSALRKLFGPRKS